MKIRPKLHGDPDHLTPSWARETREAAAHPGMHDCDVCGLVGEGSHGFGCYLGVRGHWACDAKDCRAEAQARTSGQRNLIAAE